MDKEKKPSPTHILAAKVIYEALTILKENDGEMRGKEVVAEIGKRVRFNDWESERYERTGSYRWHTILYFFTIDCMKAGFMQKKAGIWYLTKDGEEALKKYDAPALLKAANDGYVQWKKKQPGKPEVPTDPDEPKNPDFSLDDIEQKALESIENAINSKNPYEFQDLVAALLRGMGYYTPFVAPRGKDGGIDIRAYRDPLGTSTPRIKVQIKHRDNAVSSSEMRELRGGLGKEEEVGIFVSTGGFSSDARKEAITSHSHIELIDLSKFIDLWQEFYGKLSDDDKSLLPLRAVHFFSPPLS